MKTINVSEATTRQLDWLVAKLQLGITHHTRLKVIKGRAFVAPTSVYHTPKWANYVDGPANMWPIIERSQMDLVWVGIKNARASIQWLDEPYYEAFGATPLIAAARCYVMSKLGDVVEVPEELQ